MIDRGTRRLRHALRRVAWLKRAYNAVRGHPAEPEQVFSIGILAGASPWSLTPPSGVANPVLRASDVSDRRAAFVADPFMLHVEGVWSMFFEVMLATSGKGAIGLATSRDGLAWNYERIVLEEPFHLSYPHVFTWDGQHYMIPETQEVSAIRLYRAVQYPFMWRYERDLLAGRPFADATPFVRDGSWWMFAETDPGGRNDTARLYAAPDLLGPWREHPASPVVTGDARTARPAGRVIDAAEGTVRFAQDCSSRYGASVTPLLVTDLSADTYAERSLTERPWLGGSGNGWNAGGMHHVDVHPNAGGWLACVDGWYDEQPA